MSTSETPQIFLDLLAAAQAAKPAPAPKVRKEYDLIDRVTAGEVSAASKRLKAVFTAPENWTFQRNIALIHRGSETLLGNFAEYKHKVAADCRKLCRIEGPAETAGVEWVEGDNWLSQPFTGAHARVDEDAQREAVLDLHMPEFNAFAPAALVIAHISGGAILRCELFDDTRFFNRERTFHLELPAGTDVLEVLGFDCRVELRKAVLGDRS